MWNFYSNIAVLSLSKYGIYLKKLLCLIVVTLPLGENSFAAPTIKCLNI